MKDIKTIDEFIEHYKSGVRIFTDLEFEHGESFSGLDIAGTVFKNCWFCADFPVNCNTDGNKAIVNTNAKNTPAIITIPNSLTKINSVMVRAELA